MTRIEGFFETIKMLDERDRTHIEQIDKINDLEGMRFLAATHQMETQNILLMDIARSLAVIADAFYEESDET